MYSGGPSSTTFTGIYDSVEQEYQYPSARQNAVIAFSDFYLSALDGDLTTDGLSISTQTGEATDITIGNAPSAVLNATMLNPDGLMESLTWGDGAAYIGAVTSETTADFADICGVVFGGYIYSLADDGSTTKARKYISSSTWKTINMDGEPCAVVVNADGTAYYYTDEEVVYWNCSNLSKVTPDNAFMTAKHRGYDHPVGIILDANGCPNIINDVEENTKTTYDYVPMGIFDFSNVDAYGSVFTVEAYDKMTAFDADATDWINSLDFSGGLTIPNIISALVVTKFGMTYSIDANAVNRTSINWSTNPVTSYSVTYRQLLKWLAEGMACNVRLGRTGVVEFYCLHSTSVGTVTPDTIVNGSRTKYRYSVPAITKAVCYNALGAGYESGTDGSTYYVVGNPFVDPSLNIGILNNIRYRVDDIPAYYPTTINVACSDPHIDAGDFITVEDREGNTTYLVPIMHQTLYWSGMCKAEFTATGNQVRAIPSSMENSDLASVVDSNPVSVIQKIEAVGISADWITTGKLTVKDANNNVLFEADKDTKTVQIAGYNVEADKLYSTKTISSGTPNETKKVSLDTGEITLEHVYTSGNITTAAIEGGAFTAKTLNSAEEVVDRGSVGIAGLESIHNTLIGNLVTRTRTVRLTPANGLTIEDDNVSDSVTKIATLDAESITFNDGNRDTSIRAFSLHHNAGTAEASYAITLPAGMYMLIHGQYLAPNANAQGMQVLVIGTNNGSTPLVTTLGGSGSDLTATTGTRSQVTVGNSDGTSATLTWTVQGRGYRHLSIMRLY
jgi:hypothetical protein